MTSDNYTNNRLNYNSTESAKSLPHVEKLFSTRRKNISYAIAQNILSKELFRTLLVMLLMVTGVAGVWAQEDLSGTYYIGSYGKNANASDKYYLCPTEDWYYYQATNGYVANDNSQPFLTTYKCLSTSNYDTSKAVWIIEKHETEAGCYYIKQKTATPGRYKYIVSNGQISSSSNANRMRIHIEELDENSTALNDLGNMALFEIATYPPEKGKDYNFTTDYLRIKPHDPNGRNGDYIYLVVNNGNFQNLKADSSKPDGPNGNNAIYGRGTGGIISLYTLEQNAGWYLEDVIERPTISFTTDNKVQITGATGTTKIYYTTNGDRPTIGGSTTTEVEGATVSFDPADDVTTIKAIAIVNGEITNVTTFTPPVLLGSNHMRLIQSQANGWDTDFHFYIIPGDVTNNVTKVNTTSLFRPTMEWYFESAGIENGIQYYYIVNVSSNENLCYDGNNGVHMETKTDDNKFKFSIVASGGAFNIIPHGLTSGNRFINKDSNNADAKNINLTGSASAASALWKFVMPSVLDKDAPFSVSDGTSTSYYKIENIGKSGNFIIPPTGTATFAEVTASSEASANWYFEVATPADNNDWLTYYYIRNAKTGDYLYFSGTNNSRLEMRHAPETGENAPKYQFTWARTASIDQYYIVPRLWKDRNLNQIASLQAANNATTLSVAQTRTAGFAAWEFDESTYKCATPTITFNGSQYVISKKESDAKIKYTLDNGTTWNEYTSPLDTPSSTCTIKAYVYRSGDESDKSDEATFEVIKVATPAFDYSAGNSVKITCATEGAMIYYTIDTDPGTPTTASTPYTEPISGDISGKIIKAIAVKAGSVTSEVATSNSITLRCATPVVKRGNGNFALSCSFPTEGVTIKYSYASGETDPGTPTTTYSTPVSCTFPITIKAVATASGYSDSEVLIKYIGTGLAQDENDVYLIETDGDLAIFVGMVNGTEEEYANAHYRLTADVSGSGIDPITKPFTGIFEAGHDANGNYYTITDLSHALFNTVNGGTVKNVMLDDVVISSGTNVGAIANEATGAARIYNCGVLATSSDVEKDKDGYDKITKSSSTISGSNYVGSIVGLLDGEARVINCFSFADIKGGNYRGGIVGYNNVEGSNSANLKTMVMNCMYYGNIDGGNIAPIYNGYIITNRSDQSGVSNFNYFWSGASYTNSIDVYNCALSAETRYLQRFEFYRPLLNSNRELAAWWATGSLDNKEEMLKWVMEPSKIGTTTPFPILKAPGYYPSVVNIDAENAETFASDAYNQGRKFGTLTINIQDATSGAPSGANITTSTVTPPITDKDPAHFNFNYYKVQLPYYNKVGTGNYTGNKVVTGWKIVSMSKSAGSITSGSDATAAVDENGDITLTTPYNFADRNCTAKDIYSETNKRVFSQGAYFDVPEGVTSITIEPYWAQCVYVSDPYPDVVYDQNMSTANNVQTVGTVNKQARYTNGQSYPINGDDQVVYTTMSNAAGQMPTSGTVYDNAIVLVGNVHSTDVSDKSSNKAYTIMSIDLDKDNEPDYSYILRYNSRLRVHPVRVDFVNIPGLGMAQKSTGGTGTYNFGIMQPLGWFESTNTSLFRFTQFEYDYAGRANSPMILQGGVIEQWVTVGGKEQTIKEAKSVSYYHVGGNVWFKEFHIGVHQDKTQDEFVSPHPPISITGGDFNELYLTGLYNTPNANYDDNAECYINGGRFGKVAGTGMQGIGAIGGNSKGNIIWQIDNADIDEFYAGGINAAHIAEGNIYTVIKNSRVDQFCGGPKFGNMNSTKKVVTNATNCTFRAFFGAGYGGNSYNRRYPDNKNNINGNSGIGWDAWVKGQYTKKYDANYKGVETRIDYQFLPMSNNTQNVARLFVDYVSFSLATTYDVTSKLEGCTITTQRLGRLSISDDFKCLGNFYGGGSLGKVSGDVKSTLTNCTVEGSVFGAGYSATLPKVNVMNNAFQEIPHYDENTGAYTEATLPTTEEYSWVHKETVNSTATAIDTGTKKLYTTENLNELGTVTGQVTLNIDGTTAITGNVYGGGQSSDATSDVEVNVKAGSMVDVYGGGQGETTIVGGTVTVNVGEKAGNGDLSGSGSISGNVYGGSALGAVNATSTKNAEGKVTAYTPSSGKTTNVNIYAGAVTGSVFGGGLGQLESGTQGQNGYKPEIAAQNFGNTIVTMEGGTVSTGLYGGANTNGDLKGNSTVTITGGTAGTLAQSGDPNNVVFGGGYGQPTLVEGNVEINLGAANQTTAGATINGSVYGGGALGNVNTSKPESTLVFDATKTTKVNLFKGTVKGSVYGGGLGQKKEGTLGQNGYKAPVESFVGGDVTVELNNGVPDNQKGCVVEGSIFGCNNVKGTPKGDVTVHVYKTQNTAANHITNQEGDTDENTMPKKLNRYDLYAVYGGGNQAAYYPTVRDSIGVTNGSKIQVMIEGCDRTSIKYVYGGGNAAPVPATDVTIDSSFDIFNVFGGGNGQGEGNPGADVGIINKTKYDANNETGIYGTGIAETKLIGGTINTVYGGSNTKGNVRGRTSVSMPSKNDNCPLNVTAIYGAGQNAEQHGDVALELGCGVGDIYGGAQNANIQGNVNIVITGGHHPRVFGGNDTSGTIHGTISVNIEETNECDPITIGELYLGGNNASYSTYGYYVTITNGKPDVLLDENDEPILDNNNQPILKLLPRTSTSDTNNPIKSWSWNSTENKFDYTNYSQTGEDIFKDFTNPVLNVISCTSIGKIFGGGLGSDAIIYGSPTVNLNMIPGIHATDGELGRIGVTYTDPDDGTKTKTGGIFGGGNKAKVVGNTTINIGTEPTVTMKSEKDETSGEYTTHTVKGADIRSNIYGGGEEAEVTGNTQVNILAKYSEESHRYETVTLLEEDADVTIAGSVFGAGKGADTDVASAIVRGNSTIQMGGGWVKQNIYGGGELSCVGDFTFVTTEGATKDDIATYTAGGTSNVNIFAGKVGPETQTNPATYGHIYGAGKGDGSYPKFNYAQATNVTISGSAIVEGSVFGGSENGHVRGNTNVAISGGTIGVQSIKKGGATVGNVYGGGQGSTDHFDAGIVKGNTNVTISDGIIYHNIYGGGAYGSVGTITLGTATYVPGNPSVANMPTEWGTGTGKATITITGGTIGQDGDENGMIFGSSRGEVTAPTGSPAIDPNDHTAWVYDTEVTIGTNESDTGPTIFGSVYGSGENGHVFNDTDIKIYSGTIGIAKGDQVVHNNITYDADDYPYRGNVYGGGCGEDMYDSNSDDTPDMYNPLAGIVLHNTNITIAGGHVVHDVFGAGALGSVGNKSTINISGGRIGVDGDSDGNVYGAARGDLNSTQTDIAHVQETEVNIAYTTTPAVKADGTSNAKDYILGSVFGGGEAGIVKGSVAVNVSGGYIAQDVYGGGALANTNTDNWTGSALNADVYTQVTGLTEGTSYVRGLYTNDGENYTLITDKDKKAEANTNYYRYGTTYNTSVNLTGGLIGNVYGGGLGRLADTSNSISAVEAMVYGDVTITANGTAFTSLNDKYKEYWYKENDTYIKKELSSDELVPKTGRLFGCNNLNGTPKGNVTVIVRRTKRLNDAGIIVNDHITNVFEIRGVYGGGNQANYLPATNKKTAVEVFDCDNTSIDKVYGGGNSASVPTTNVTIFGALQIHYVFGGGNGADVVWKNNRWQENDGANVTGDAHVVLKGGNISDAFIGSDTKGTVQNAEANVTTESGGDCNLKLTNFYGSSKRAPVYGNVDVKISACSQDDIENVYGGSYDAQIHGNITMTVTSGILKNVFGGNDRLGNIGGNITINIEEADECKPIIIQNIYGGGFNAPYPGEGAQRITNEPDGNGGFVGATKDESGNWSGLNYETVTSGKITINVKSCTRIDNIFGGGLGEKATVTGETEINVNMKKGVWVNQPLPNLGNYPGSTPPNIHTAEMYARKDLTVGESVSGLYTRSGSIGSYEYTLTNDGTAQSGKTYYEKTTGDVINDAIGTIGNIYGGGDQGNIIGNATVNIGNKTKINHLVYDSQINEGTQENPKWVNTYTTQEFDVLGANITGDVYGGGNKAEVTGNTYVNISSLMTPVANSNPTTYTYTKVNHANTTGFEGLSIGGSVYGGGNKADIKKNTNVRMSDGYVFNGIFGGGYSGSVGTFERAYDGDAVKVHGHTPHEGCIGKPVSCAAGTGTCTVVVDGGQIGPVTVVTEGMTRKDSNNHGNPVAEGWIWGGGCGLIENPEDEPDTHFKTYVNETNVTISGSALIMESVIGGGEFGRVLHNTNVTIAGGQIGASKVDTNNKPVRFAEADFIDPTTATASDIESAANNMPECSHFPYGIDSDNDGKKEYLPYDPYYDKYKNTFIENHSDYGPASTDNPSDGKTWIGCVFGGGSGYMPHDNGSGYDWIRSAGWVEGNANLTITGGHILTNVYGGNEYTDVGTPGVANTGKCTVKMSGGTIGVPRTLQQIADHPVTCYLFGGGKGDERTHFDQFTNVNSVEVEVSGGIIYGSVFGGAEDGHVLGDAKVEIKPGAKIGTWGTSYVDGNVFGGGRGFSGGNLIAGGVGGNTTINITGGTMMGSIYGGGRLASVGIDLDEKQGSDSYGQLKDETGNQGDPTYGHITINISGGKIGTTTAANDDSHPVGGNVFGGSMGRITLLDGSTNPMWPKMAVAKLTEVNIYSSNNSTAEIMNNVYGGSEYGIVRNRTTVNVSAGTIHGHVFGGGYGSDEQEKTTITAGGYSTVSPNTYYTFSPMMWTGCVSGDTNVNISGGKVKKNVYGGGEFASVGLINFNSDKDGNYNYITKHENPDNGFALSWPYEFQYITAAPNDATSVGGKTLGGKATVTITGGRIGTDGDGDGNGFVFGGSKGKTEFDLYNTHTHNASEETCIINEQRYVEAFCANVRETEVKVNYASTPEEASVSSMLSANSTDPCIVGAVYGGGEDGHVAENTKVEISGGLIGYSVYGGGKGIGRYKGYLRDQSSKAWKPTAEDLYSWTAGKVYGNTEVIMHNGYVVRSVYGGGYNGCVGKGNYASGVDDYYPHGYGEKISSNLWTSASTGDNAWHFLNSGKTSVTIEKGTVGTPDGEYYGLPTGQVFGGARGLAAEDVTLSPRDEYAPDFFLGYVNESEVKIGDASDATKSPIIYGSVYGGGRDGHVRRDAHVIINNGTIGLDYTNGNDGNIGKVGESNINHFKWKERGNVFGSGSGISTWNGTRHGKSSGSVTCKTTVDINGGKIYQSVYGGGAMASVGPPRIPTNDVLPPFAEKEVTQCVVNINGGEIGTATGIAANYGGSVFGASRGGELADDESVDDYATTIWNEVNIMGGTIAGDVYGGGEAGLVKKDNIVNLTGGIIKHDAYGGGKGTTNIAANVGGNATVELNKNVTSERGCAVNRIFGSNNLNGSPKGHVLVHVYATQNKNKATVAAKYPKEGEGGGLEKGSQTDKEYLKTLIDYASPFGITVTSYNAIYENASEEQIKQAITDILADIAKKETRYDVEAVYGGGNLAAYVPNNPATTTEEAEVIIEGCDLTSIYQVYGGGNAASTPATKLTINSAYEIFEAFGGGNGNDPYTLNGKTYENPGANVGYEDYSTPTWNATDNQYDAIDNNDASTKEEREANYGYGTGVATTNVRGGTIHTVFGGSNKKGNIRKTAMSVYEASDDLCPLCVGETYGAGKEAPMDGDIDLTLDCVKDMPIIYGGAKDADVNANITLNITNGTFEKVFGGNNTSGAITGSITVNVEERGCQPIFIKELYGGGYLAPYSIYGYEKDNNGNYTTETINGIPQRKPLTSGANPQKNPRINIISATRIDNIYGGGYQAKVVGSPRINVNMQEGTILAKYMDDEENFVGEHTDNDGNTYTGKELGELVTLDDATTRHTGILAIGKIGNIYGGGNQADIVGDTYVEIGTGKWINKRGILETLGTVGNETKKKTYIYNVDTYDNDKNKWGYETTTTENETTTTTFTAVEGIPTPARNAAEITGIVYGGGNEGDVTSNTYITMENGSVYNRIYGGGNKGNVGTIETKITPTGHNHTGTCIQKPDTWKDDTGVCNVTVSGGRVGPLVLKMPDDYGHVFGAGRGETKDPAEDPDIDFEAYVNETYVTIEGTALICGGVYGGSENGRVRGDTHVYIKGGQIGVGEGAEGAYAENQFINPIETPVTAENELAECAHWDYKEPFKPYDEVGATEGGATTGSDGHSFYGNVFGGGSGYYPYKKSDNSYEWLRSAGLVEGNTNVEVTGGHILNNLYGGNEMSDVTGTCNVKMTGGTLGVPRTLEQIKNQPVCCYLFGAGKGDQRTHFNTSTNVGKANITVGGNAIIYGSVFGGGEDGHVLEDINIEIQDGNNTFTVGTGENAKTYHFPIIGTTGTSYVDGNIFGAGRGYSGDALTAGSVGGNINVDIKGGTMLGSIYGGGRLASVGTNFAAPNDPLYGSFKEDVLYKEGDDIPEGKKAGDIKTSYGHVTVNISGGTIGNDVPDAKYGGNVFGGSMGRLESLLGQPNPLWPQLAQVKTTTVNISGNAHIKRSVYGGGELGTVRDDAIINISGETNTDGLVVMDESPTIEYNVFGGGYGSDINEDTYQADIHTGSGETAKTYTFRPIEFAGCVGGDTHVNIRGGLIKRTVYGGGEMATVGLVDLNKSKSQIHDDVTSGFALSWPYEYAFIQEKGGTANIEVTGGRIGLSGKDKINSDVEEDNGDIYGGGKGIAGDRYEMGFCGNVRNSKVTINVPTPTNDQIEIYDRTGSNKWTLRLKKQEATENKLPGIAGSVYGGGEDGHVLENATINIRNGYIGHSVYGGGKGKGTYKQAITDKDIPCNTAGKVYGNTTIEMTGGWIMRNIYGGGNLGSVGKGNYAGGTDDYYQGGYGEKSSGKLWTSDYDPNDTNTSKDDAWHFLNSGKATVNVTGGTVGYMVSASDKKSVCEKDDLPTGNVFGGCRGQAATEEFLPTYDQNPDFFLGYVNETSVTIGDATNTTEGYTGPRIYGSVYGAGQDGHVRYQTNVTINKGEIGIPYNADNKAIFGTNLDDLHWLNRGNVYGSGSGIGTYESRNKDVNDKPIELFSSSSGSTTRNTNVTVNSGIDGKTGGVIYRNVYGGGSMASVGPPLINMTEYATKEQSLCNVTIDGAVGTTDENIFVKEYGGEVYGASRGESLDPALYNNFADFASVIWTKVLVKKNAVIMGNVFGGGDAGVVKKDSEVIVGE